MNPSPPVPPPTTQRFQPLPPELLAGPDVEGLVRWIRRNRGQRIARCTPAEAEFRELLAESLSPDEVSPVLLQDIADALATELRWKPMLHPRLQTHRGTVGRLF